MSAWGVGAVIRSLSSLVLVEIIAALPDSLTSQKSTSPEHKSESSHPPVLLDRLLLLI